MNAVFVMDGRDPYKNKIDPGGKLLPSRAWLPTRRSPTISSSASRRAELDALDDLPASASVKYDLVPTSLVAQNAWMPLAIDNPKNPNPDGHVQEIELTELDPGTENGVAHALYIEGDARTVGEPGR